MNKLGWCEICGTHASKGCNCMGEFVPKDELDRLKRLAVIGAKSLIKHNTAFGGINKPRDKIVRCKSCGLNTYYGGSEIHTSNCDVAIFLDLPRKTIEEEEREQQLDFEVDYDYFRRK